MQPRRVGLVGASGYTGRELTHLLERHDGLEPAFLTSRGWAGSTVRDRLGPSGRLEDLRYITEEAALERAGEVEVVLLATPPEASRQLVPRFLERSVRVIDLSNAYRVDPDIPAVYGLPELFRRDVPAASLVANPGCYPTAAALALAPFFVRGLIEDTRIIVDAASGVSGAGQTTDAAFTLMEMTGDFRAYKVLRHQHTPEIAQILSRAANRAVPVTFTPHLLPVPRGILATCYATLSAPLTSAAARAVLSEAYSGERFVSVAASADEVSLRQVVGTNLCLLGASCAEAGGEAGDQLVVVAAIDNLLKGAAGQAMQNVNLLLGLAETAGLTGLRRTLG